MENNKINTREAGTKHKNFNFGNHVFNFLKNNVKYSALLGFVVLPNKEAIPQNNRVDYKKDQVFTKEERGGLVGIDFHPYRTIFRGDNISENVIGALSPLAVGIETRHRVNETLEIEIPYEYAKDFERIETTEEGKARRQELKEYLGKKIREKLNSSINGIGWGVVDSYLEKVFREVYPEIAEEMDGFSNLKIQKIKITGHASPEAFIYGPNAVTPGDINDENVEVALRRAQDPIWMEVLEELGIELGVDMEIDFDGQELQFSDEESPKLVDLAKKLGFLDENMNMDGNEKIVWRAIGFMIEDYNQGRYIDNVEIQEELDRLVGSKRGDLLELKLEGEFGRTRTIAIPLTLLIVFGLSRFLRKKDNKKTEDLDAQIEEQLRITEEQGKRSSSGSGFESGLRTSDDRIFSEKFVNTKTYNKTPNVIVGSVLEANDKGVGFTQKKRADMVKKLLEKEIGERMFKEEAKMRGVDYMSFIEDMRTKYTQVLFEKAISDGLANLFNKLHEETLSKYNFTKNNFFNINLLADKNTDYVNYVSGLIASNVFESFKNFLKSIPLENRVHFENIDEFINTMHVTFFEKFNMEREIISHIERIKEELKKKKEEHEKWNNFNPKTPNELVEKQNALRNILLPKYKMQDLMRDVYLLVEEPFQKLVHTYIGPNLEKILPNEMKEFREEMVKKMLYMWVAHDRTFDDNPKTNKFDLNIKSEFYIPEENGLVSKTARILNSSIPNRHSRRSIDPTIKQVSPSQDPMKITWAQVMVENIMLPVLENSMKRKTYTPFNANIQLLELAQQIIQKK